MSQQRVIAVVILVVGVALLVMGLNASHSMADQLSNTFTGRFTDSTTWYILGGLGATVGGLVMLGAGGRGTHA